MECASRCQLEEERMFGALCDQVAVALERIRLGNERDEARLAVESERLRTALLSSLSHDLKTPLASIMGAITALRQFPALYDAAAREELAGTIQDEAERMTRFVTNLLDMTRLEAGGLSLDREPVDVGEVVGTALRRGGWSPHRAKGHGRPCPGPADAGSGCGVVRAGAGKPP